MSRFIPRGVVVAGLGRRVVAAVVDAAPPVVVGIGASLILGAQQQPSATVVLVTIIAASVLIGGYGLYQWWAYGTRGAGIGATATGLNLVGMDDGHPIGWWRCFIRYLVFSALMATVIGGIALLVFLVIHERRQGWHDMAAGAIVVQPKPGEHLDSGNRRKAATPSTVGLPPHLSSSFSPQVGRTEMGNRGAEPPPPEQHSPAWMPRLETQPLIFMGPEGQLPFARPGQTHPQTPSPQQAPPMPQQTPPPPTTPARPINQGWIPLPTPTSIIEPPNTKPKVRPRDFGEVEDDSDGTRIAAPVSDAVTRRGHEDWYARLDDGREVELSVTVLLGRNPQRTTDDSDVHLVPAGGDGRMISRTHVLIGTDARGVFIVDRGSTNGTALVTPGGGLEPCPVGTQIRVKQGQQVSYGNRWFTVLRRPEGP